jgi:hypothetical protein
MAAPTTTDQWDEYVMGLAQGSITQVDSWNVGLYDDATDTIVSSNDIADITTEPTGEASYSTKTITPSTAASLTIGTDTTVDIDDQTWSSLSTSGTTTVDAFYVSVDVQLDGDGSVTEHLMFVGTLSGGPYNLDNYTDFTAQDMGVTQTQS